MRLRGPLVAIAALGLAVLAVGLVAVWTSITRTQARHTTMRISRTQARHTTMRISRPDASHATMPSTTITINSVITFAPPPSDARPALTAEQARRQAERHQGSRVTAIPPGLTVSLGFLSVFRGPNNSIQDELAWGYSVPSTCGGGSPAQPLPLRPCVGWEFVDANTGWMIIATEQYNTKLERSAEPTRLCQPASQGYTRDKRRDSREIRYVSPGQT